MNGAENTYAYVIETCNAITDRGRKEGTYESRKRLVRAYTPRIKMIADLEQARAALRLHALQRPLDAAMGRALAEVERTLAFHRAAEKVAVAKYRNMLHACFAVNERRFCK